MDKKTIKSFNNFIAGSVVIVIIAAAIVVFTTSFFQLPKLDLAVYHHIASQHFLQRLLALILLVVVWNLYLRKRAAWLICVISLTASLFLNFALHYHFVTFVVIILEIYALFALILTRDHFKRSSDKLSLKNTGVLACVVIAAVLLNAALGYFNLGAVSDMPRSFGESLLNTFRMLFETDGSMHAIHSYELFVFFFVWLSVAACVFMLFRSAVIEKNITKTNKERARDLVKKYGQNPMSYLSLEDDKHLYFSSEVEGVIAYGYVGGVVAVLGDPVCAGEDFLKLLAEFKSFCKEGSYECVFIGTTDIFIEQYSMLGYNHVKCGEEARFDLKEFQLAGGKMAKLRSNVNSANRANLTTLEYKPNEKRDATIEKAMDSVSEQWLEGKKSGELGFTLGGVGLEDPMDRRYFYALDQEGKIVAFNVYIPFACMDGYLADITRRVTDAPHGVTEKINYDAFMVFKDEGLGWASLGLAPLAHMLEGDEKDHTSAKLLNLVYEKMNSFYGFKSLFIAKEKYSPSRWVPGYFVYSTRGITPEIAYAIVAIQNPGGIKDYIAGFLRGKTK